MCESKICLLSWASRQYQPGQAGLLLLAELGIEVIRAKRYEWFSHDAKILLFFGIARAKVIDDSGHLVESDVTVEIDAVVVVVLTIWIKREIAAGFPLRGKDFYDPLFLFFCGGSKHLNIR